MKVLTMRLVIKMFLVLLLSGCASSPSKIGSNYNEISVKVKSNASISEAQIKQRFTESLLKKGYKVSSSGLNPDAILKIEITDYQVGERESEDENGNKKVCKYVERLSISAQLVDQQSGDIIWMETESYKSSLLGCLSTLSGEVFGYDEIDKTCFDIIKKFPPRNIGSDKNEENNHA